jgi:hypothetical protein
LEEFGGVDFFEGNVWRRGWWRRWSDDHWLGRRERGWMGVAESRFFKHKKGGCCPETDAQKKPENQQAKST